MPATRRKSKAAQAADEDVSVGDSIGSVESPKTGKKSGGGLGLVAVAVAIFAIAIAAGFGAKQAGLLDGALAPAQGAPEPPVTETAPAEAAPATETEAVPAEAEPVEAAPTEPEDLYTEPVAGEAVPPAATSEAKAAEALLREAQAAGFNTVSGYERAKKREAAAQAAQAAQAAPAAPAAPAEGAFKLYARNTAEAAELRLASTTDGVVLDHTLAPGAEQYLFWGARHAFVAVSGDWGVEVQAFTTDAGDQAFAFKNLAAGPVSLEVHGASAPVQLAPGAQEGFVAGPGHHFWVKDAAGQNRFGVAAYPADS